MKCSQKRQQRNSQQKLRRRQRWVIDEIILNLLLILFFRKPSTKPKTRINQRASMMARTIQRINMAFISWFSQLKPIPKEISWPSMSSANHQALPFGFVEEFIPQDVKASSALSSSVSNRVPFKFWFLSTKTFQSRWWNFLDRELNLP